MLFTIILKAVIRYLSSDFRGTASIITISYDKERNDKTISNRQSFLLLWLINDIPMN